MITEQAFAERRRTDVDFADAYDDYAHYARVHGEHWPRHCGWCDKPVGDGEVWLQVSPTVSVVFCSSGCRSTYRDAELR